MLLPPKVTPRAFERLDEIGAADQGMALRIVNGRIVPNEVMEQLVNPGRPIPMQTTNLHGITDDMVAQRPPFDVVGRQFHAFAKESVLVAHNAPFDVGFIDHEFGRLNRGVGKTADFCTITDTLAMAKKIFPGKRNNLDVLCDRYGIDNSHRTLHGALLDAEILADVYLLMTGGQTALQFSDEQGENGGAAGSAIKRVESSRKALKVLHASADEIEAHNGRLDLVEKGGACLWRS
mgnify:CR=1 FL=1